MKRVFLALSFVCQAAFAGVMWGVSGKILRFDAETVTVQVDGERTLVTVPRSSVPGEVPVRPKQHVDLTLRNRDIAHSHISYGK